MKLYCPPGPASLAPQIALTEAGLSVDRVEVGQVGLDTGGNWSEAIAPFGYIPALEFNDDLTLRGVPVILQFIADFSPQAGLAPAAGTLAAVRVSEWLHFTADLFPTARFRDERPAPSIAERDIKLALAWADLHVTPSGYLAPCGYSIADIFLWVMIDAMRRGGGGPGVAPFFGNLGNLDRWYHGIAERPAVRPMMSPGRAARTPAKRLALAR